MIRSISSLLVLCTLMGGSLAQFVCPEDQNDDNLEVLFPPTFDEDKTRVVFRGQTQTFEAFINVPLQYTRTTVSFLNTDDTSGSFDTNSSLPSQYWTVNNTADPCNTVLEARIPFEDLRRSVGGVTLNNVMNGIQYEVRFNITSTKQITVVPETLLEMQNEGVQLQQISGTNYTRTVSLVVPFQIRFITRINVDDDVYIPANRLRLAAALLDTSVVEVTTNPLDARARLEVVTTVPLPLILNDASIIVSEPKLQNDLAVTELVALRQCDINFQFCVQRWEINVEPDTLNNACDISGQYNMTVTATCHDQRQGCNSTALIEPQAVVSMDVVSDSFCPDVQQINIDGNLELYPTECNDLLTGKVTVENIDFGAYINATRITEVRAYPKLADPEPRSSSNYFVVYNADALTVELQYASDEGSLNDEVNFQFLWEGSVLRCDVEADIEVDAEVVWGATRELLEAGDKKLLSFRGNSKDGKMQLMQSSSQVDTVTAAGSAAIGAGASSTGAGTGGGLAAAFGDMSSPMMIGLITGLSVLLLAIVAGGAFYVRRLTQNGEKEADEAEAEADAEADDEEEDTRLP